MALPQKPGMNKTTAAGTPRRVPAIQQPTRPAATTAKNGQTSLGGKMIFGLAAIVVVGIVALFWAAPLLVKRYNNANYTSSYIEVEMLREATKTARPNLDLDKTFSQENMREMENGKGLKVIMVTKVRDKEINRRTIVTLEPWESFEATSYPERRRNIAEVKDRLTSMVTNFDINQNWVIDFILDDTEGVDEALAQKATVIFNKLELDERIKIGDGVDISFTRLSSNDYLQREQIIVPVKSGSSKYMDIRAGLDKLLAKRPGKSESSVARGLLNALNANSGRENREIIIISDGLENSPDTGVTFYNEKGLKQLDPSNWEALDQTFLKDIEQPQLNGGTVAWYAPPAAAKHSKQVQLGFKYWTHLLAKLGAVEVNTHFGI